MNANTMNITSFISQLAKSNELFPKKQLLQFSKSKNSACPSQKYVNIFQSYEYQFKRNYSNLQQMVLLSSLCLLKNQTCLIQNILEFLQDLITSKMILVCVQHQQLKIYQKLDYLQKLTNILVPFLLREKMQKQIMRLIKKCNKENQRYVSINFLLQFLLIKNIFNYISKDSAQKFKKFMRKFLLKEKMDVIERYWKNQSSKTLLKFNQLVYFRSNVDDYKIDSLFLQKGMIKAQINKNQPPNWVIQAYKRNITINDIGFTITKNTKIMEIYKFLLQLQILLSSPRIQEVQEIIPNQQFLNNIFSNFLQGNQLYTREYKYRGHQTTQYLNQIKNKYQSFSQPYKEILRIQLQKLNPKVKSKENLES